MRKQLAAAVLVGVLSLAGGSLAAQGVRFGPQLDFGTNSLNLGIGGRLDLNLAQAFGAPLTGVGSFDYFFGSNGFHLWEINANLFYNFKVPKSNITPYAGGGLDVAGSSCSGCVSSTEAALNLGGGLKFKLPHSKMTPYVEAMLQLHSSTDLVLTGGILF